MSLPLTSSALGRAVSRQARNQSIQGRPDLGRRSALLALLVLCAIWLGGCFKPSYPEDLACGEDDWCPPGQLCNPAGICVIDTGEPFPDASTIDATPPPVRIGVDIGPDQTLPPGATYQFSAEEVWSDGSRIPIPPSELLIWRSTDNNVVYLDFNGLATAASEGQATVTGRYEGLIDAAEIMVVAP